MVERINGKGELYRNAFKREAGMVIEDFRNINFVHGRAIDLKKETETLQTLETGPAHFAFDKESILFYNVTNPSKQSLDVLWIPRICPPLPVERQEKDRPPVEGRTYIVKTYSPLLPKPIPILVFADDVGVAERQIKSERSREMNGLGPYSRDIDAYPRLVTTDEFVAEARRQMEAGEFIPNFIINEFPSLIELSKKLYYRSKNSKKQQ